MLADEINKKKYVQTNSILNKLTIITTLCRSTSPSNIKSSESQVVDTDNLINIWTTIREIKI